MLANLTALANVVLSTGGGAVLRPDNRSRLRDNGTVIYLHAEPSTLWGRIGTAATGRLCKTADRSPASPNLPAADALYRADPTMWSVAVK